MVDTKVELAGPYPVRLSKDVIRILKEVARRNERSLGQQLRYLIMDSYSRLQKSEIE